MSKPENTKTLKQITNLQICKFVNAMIVEHECKIDDKKMKFLKLKMTSTTV